MTIFADASALVALATKEAEADRLALELEAHNDRLFSALSAWEAALAVARKRTVPINVASAAVDVLLFELNFRHVPIGEAEKQLAIEAHRVYGKGTGHPAKLNMGDCFSYACAKANGAALLYKGDDFSRTDLA